MDNSKIVESNTGLSLLPGPTAAPAPDLTPASVAPSPLPQSGARRGGAVVLAAGLFLLLAALLTWPRLGQAAAGVVDFGDPLEDIWTLQWIDHALLTDPAHLYDAPIFYGFPQPLAYDDINIGQALLALPLTALTGNLILTYNLLIVGSFALAGWCAFLLARHVTGSAWAGLIAGMVYGFWSYTFAHLSHMSVLSLYPIPLALLCLHRVFETADAGARRRVPVLWAAAFAACVIWQALNSFYYAAYLGLAAGALLLWELLVVRRWRAWPGPQRGGVAAALLGAWLLVGLAVAVLSAPYRTVQAEMDFRRTTAEQTTWAARPTDYLGVSPRNRTYRQVLPQVWPEPLFPGFAALLLGVIGLGALGRRARRRADLPSPPGAPAVRQQYLLFYALLMAGAWVLTLGPVLQVGSLSVPMPYQALAALPGFSGLRSPVRLVVLAALGWGVLAGWGLQRILDFGFWILERRRQIESKIQNPKSKILAAGVTLVLLAVMAGEQWTVLTPNTPLPHGGALPPVYQWLAAHPDGGAVAEFPLIVGLRDPARTTIRMFYQGAHQHPLINGYSSFVPPTYIELVNALDQDMGFSDRDLGILQSLDTRYLVFDRQAYKRSHWRRLMDTLPRYPPVRLAAQFGDEFEGHALFTLASLSDAQRLRLEAIPPRRVAPGAPAPLDIRITNGYTYPLLTRLQPELALDFGWEPIGSSDAPGSWTRRTIPVPLTVDPGTATFHAEIPAPPAPGPYRLRVMAVPPVPRYVLVASSTAVDVAPAP